MFLHVKITHSDLQCNLSIAFCYYVSNNISPGKYDICVLPLSIAHFEIECPCVIFISPTLLGGDRSYVGYSLARNISQIWAGNLVTCCNYEHLWLNKSFSIFISRKIMRKFLCHQGIDVFLQREGLKNLNSLVQEPANVALLKCLLPNLKDLSPDVATKYVPYERGYFLLCHLENMLGGPTLFEPFLKSYFNNFGFRSINTADWLHYLYQKFPNNKEMLDGVEWRLWFGDTYSTPVLPELSQKSLWELRCSTLAEKWIKCDSEAHNYVPLVTAEWHLCNVERIILLRYLHSSRGSLTIEKLNSISNCLFRHIRNNEMRLLWLLLCIKVGWPEKVKSALYFAIKYCSTNYACSIFQSLYEWPQMSQRTVTLYHKNKEKMLDETRARIGQILHQNL